MTHSDKAHDAIEKQYSAPSITHPDQYGNVSAKSQNSSRDENKNATEAQILAGNLPSLSVDEQKNTHWWTGGAAVAEDLAKGAYNEATQHPLHLIESAALGASAGAALAFASPEIAAGAAVLVGGYATYQVYENGRRWLNGVTTVSDQVGHTSQEIAAAHATILGLGAGVADIAVGVGSGALAGRLAAGILAAPDAAPVVRVPDLPAAPEVPSTTTLAPVAPVAQITPVVPPSPVAPSGVEVAPATLPPPPAQAPSIYNQPLNYDRPAGVPFTEGETSMQLSDPQAWNSLVDSSGKNAYSSLIFRFANNWATAMEGKIAAGEPLSRPMIMSAADQSGADGVSGAMASQVENLLIQTWKYGPEFRDLLSRSDKMVYIATGPFHADPAEDKHSESQFDGDRV